MSRSHRAGLGFILLVGLGIEACAAGGGAQGVDWSGVPRHARAAADSIYAALARETRLTPQRSRGEVNSIYRFCHRPAARVELAWRSGAQAPSDPLAFLDRELPRMGWTLDESHRTDGPDGTVYSFTRGKLLCVIEGRWDGGLDDDSTAVIDPGKSLLVDVASADPCKDDGPRD
jgi:hypothetical protein